MLQNFYIIYTMISINWGQGTSSFWQLVSLSWHRYRQYMSCFTIGLFSRFGRKNFPPVMANWRLYGEERPGTRSRNDRQVEMICLVAVSLQGGESIFKKGSPLSCVWGYQPLPCFFWGGGRMKKWRQRRKNMGGKVTVESFQVGYANELVICSQLNWFVERKHRGRGVLWDMGFGFRVKI